MKEPGLTQRLLSILAADAAGYARLMAADDRGTVAALDAARGVFRTLIGAADGRLINMAGDSVLAAFETAAGAVQTAIAVQQRLEEVSRELPEPRRLRFRIGVHLGDVIEKDDGSVHGDGVKIAARLQALAEPGGVNVSAAVQGLVLDRVAASFDDLGEQQVKSIAQPVRAYRVRAHGDAGAQALRFGRFELQPRERRLLVDGVAANLGARAFDLLLALARRPDQLVTKHQLMDLVWHDIVVEENNLQQHMSALRRLLGPDAIATVPGRGYRFSARLDGATARPAAPPAPVEPPATKLNTHLQSALTPLIGRDDDLMRLRAALRSSDCITLTGPAGVGKTALARSLAAGWQAGAVWVDLGPLADAPQAAAALARALDVPPTADDAALLRALGARLLVLDNAEQLVGAAAALAARLLHAAVELRLLVTSQLPLSIARERVHRIEPLALPLDSDTLDLHRGAVALLVERVQAADHRFRGASEALPLLREICRRLDGLPLALEMAAARVPALGLGGVRDALDRRFALLTSGYRDGGARHRTLRAALDWSHGLLGADEQRLFGALGVFAGGFTLELAVAVGGGDRWALIDALSVLVERSLVATDAREPPRYRLLETMRDYAVEQLTASGDEPAVRERHARALLALFRPAYDFDDSSAHALAEPDNARAAIDWARAHDPALAAELALRVVGAATFTSWRLEALRWLEGTAALVDDARVPPALRAEWWYERARHSIMSREPAALDRIRHARALHAAIGDAEGEFRCMLAQVRAYTGPSDELPALCEQLKALAARHPEWQAGHRLHAVLAIVCRWMGDNEGRLAHRLAEFEHATRAGDKLMVEVADTNVVNALQHLGRHDEALARVSALLRRMGDGESTNVAFALVSKMASLIELGRYADARALMPRGLALAQRFRLPVVSEWSALLVALEGRPHAAARLIGHARALYAAAGWAPEREVVAVLERAQVLVLERLDAATCERLVSEGGCLDEAQADGVLYAQDDA